MKVTRFSREHPKRYATETMSTREKDHPGPSAANVVHGAVPVEVRADIGQKGDRLAKQDGAEKPGAGDFGRKRAGRPNPDCDPGKDRDEDDLPQRHCAADCNREGGQKAGRKRDKRGRPALSP